MDIYKGNFVALELSDDFLEEINKDLKINDLDLRGQCTDAPNVSQKYIEKLYRERRKLKEFEVACNKVRGKLFGQIRRDGLEGIAFTSSSDILRLVEKDKEYIKIKRALNDQQVIVDFLDDTVRNFNNRNAYWY